jgi:hypothetical protein
VPDAQLHAAVLEAPPASVELDDCADIRSEDLRGECQLYWAFNLGGQLKLEPGTRCAELEGVWRDECFFLAAEQVRRRRSDPQAAGRLCAQAGRFGNDCGQHLWQTPVAQIAGRHARSLDLEGALKQATPVYCEWDPVLGEGTDFRSRFWSKLYGGILERHAEVDLGHCDRLEDEAHALACTEAAELLYLRRIHGYITHEPDFLCDRDPLTVESVSGVANLAAEPHPDLQRLLEEQYDWACVERKGGLPPGKGGGPGLQPRVSCP